ncbi:DUF3011 domain-containing protein [Xanthomonas translucens pv. secalis]|uniref:DUF3011 domain-containing protein n=1 Tax=Xanthomonas campestris pv. translucens TaxID=343 RepID=UPI001F1A185E|nr:DUF3011 domain-containing protein [Xanthomonas translucens]UKE42665.1 DUF3011 domain-containing protein [Xanthomonas translucens pv. secalis]
MLKQLSGWLLMAGLALASGPVVAQSARAYAPEDLRQLSMPSRVRVIEREYADQTRGRQIPDDQLEFYMDQIDRGWGFGRIQQDIATSLRGSSGQWRPQPGFDAQTVACSSNDRRRCQCATPFRGRARLVGALSDSPCIEGQTWGSGPGVVWVDGGCRGRFAEGRGGWGDGGGPGPGGTIRCESQDRRQRVCNTGWRDAVLVRQLSDTRCIEGRSWGQRDGMVWVDDGCRGEFAEGRGRGGGGWGPDRPPSGDDYSVTCSSDDKRLRSCAWDRGQGRPSVIQQLSGTTCVEGRNWGYEGNAVWVKEGCRARFGAR